MEKLKIKVDVFNKNFENGILYFIFYNSFDVLESEISFKIWKVIVVFVKLVFKVLDSFGFSIKCIFSVFLEILGLEKLVLFEEIVNDGLFNFKIEIVVERERII